MALTKVTSAGLTDDSIVNADINSSAAVALSKLATDPSNASNLASGTVPTARLGSGTASSSTVLYGDQTYKAEPGGGITEYDIWDLTTSFTGNATPIASNLQRSGVPAFEKIGTGMSESSGIFSFPSTGKWEVTFYIMQYPAPERYSQHSIQVTTNDSSYSDTNTITVNLTDEAGGIDGQMGVGTTLIDVTDIANVKVRFVAVSQNTSSGLHGASGYHYTSFFFKRIGDT